MSLEARVSRASAALFAVWAAVTCLHAGPSTIKTPFSAHTFATTVTVFESKLQPTYGTEAAPEGHEYLVLTSTWEATADRALAQKRGLNGRIRIDKLNEALSLVLDGAEIFPVEVREATLRNLNPENSEEVGDAGGATHAAFIRPVHGLKDEQGRSSLAYLDLSEIGQKISGDLVFTVPKRDWKTAELIFHDPIAGDFRTLIAGNSVTDTEPAGIQRNEVFALAAKLLEASPGDTATAPVGRRYVVVEFAGKSLLKVRDRVSPYDPNHDPGEEYDRPDPAGWMEFRNNVELIADGILPCAMDASSDVPAEISFAPDIWTRLRLIYLVPAQTKSLELLCFFPTYTIPGIEGDVQPKIMHFQLKGPVTKTPALVPKPEKKMLDGPLELSVVQHAFVSSFAGESAGENERFLVVDFQIHDGEAGEFKPSDQLVWFDHGGEVAPDPITSKGAAAPPDFFYVGPDTAYTFQVVWRLPSNTARAELGFKGNTVAQKFSLNLKP